MPQLGRELQPSRALAAFRLGHLGVSMWVWAEVLWFLLVSRSQGWFWNDGAKVGVPATADGLLAARRVLYDLVPPRINDDLTSTIEWFREFNEQLIEKADAGTYNFAEHNGRAAPWEEKSRELRFYCEQAIPRADSLHPLFELGKAFGEFHLHVNRYYSRLFIGDHADEDERPLPEIGELARRADLVPAAILDRSRLLISLARIARDGEIGHPGALIRYFEENKACWEWPGTTHDSRPEKPPQIIRYGLEGECVLEVDSRGPELDFDHPMSLSLMATGQVLLVEEDLAGVPDEFFSDGPVQQGEIHWDKGEGKLWIGAREICVVAVQARNLRPILQAFEDRRWPEYVPNPLRAIGKTEPSSLTQALAGLREKARGHLAFFERTDRVYWTRVANL